MLSTNEINILDQILEQHKGEIEDYTGSECIELLNSINDSVLMSSYPDAKLEACLKILKSHNQTLILVIKVRYQNLGSKYISYTTENQLLGLKKLDFDYGNILIRPETMGDKFSELFHRIEIDFDSFPLFSSRYYFQSDNESLAKLFATEHRLTLMEQQREAEIEIRNDILIIRYGRVVSFEDFESLLGFIKEI